MPPLSPRLRYRLRRPICKINAEDPSQFRPGVVYPPAIAAIVITLCHLRSILSHTCIRTTHLISLQYRSICYVYFFFWLTWDQRWILQPPQVAPTPPSMPW
ncbi:hypothetical protein PHLGIDRAFT_413845 [Phlebiopsis gigantea 11061_1 CR5-6]|uniref:Uncharacterized protein n=1 Tax=Phlebiopsis gigantea (strain 11061_1 CR5-6) TaxID=745531 RepID=A0A0C3PLZ8_PHLG1|nr:hypothetical protein PHLGIDRAFT_413845 [Phlebiopsis gigantea 11061_1 CR5-6]